MFALGGASIYVTDAHEKHPRRCPQVFVHPFPFFVVLVSRDFAGLVLLSCSKTCYVL